MKSTHFTKVLCFLLSFCMVLSGMVFAVPTVETVEPTEEQQENAQDETVLAAKGNAPGLNMITSTTAPWDFETESTAAYTTVFGGNSATVVDNPASNTVNSSDKVLRMPSTAQYVGLTFYCTSTMDAKRPIYASFKYRMSYEPAADETYPNATCSFWLMKDSMIGADIGMTVNGEWKQFAKTVDMTKSETPGNQSKLNADNYSRLGLQTGVSTGLDGTSVLWYDDILYMPYYKVSYLLNDGTDTVVSEDYFLFDDEGNILTSYTPDLSVTVSDDRYGYIFSGWSTDAAATEAMTEGDTVTLANEDVKLYAVWARDPDVPEQTEYHWDFEDASSQVWKAANTGYSLTYKNGMAILNTQAATYSGTPYLCHTGVSLDCKAHRYLVINARSLGTVSRLKFYFTTSDYTSASEKQTVYIDIDPNATTFREYYVDMSTNSYWTGNYKSCMLQATSGQGIVQFEDIYFTTVYDTDSAAEVVKQYHYPMSKLSAWGHSSVATNDDGTVLLTRVSGTQGAINLAAPGETLDTSVYSKLVIKAKDADAITSFSIYYQTSTVTGYAESRKKETSLSTATDGDYKYYVLDLEGLTGWEGNVSTFMLAANTVGSITISDVYLTNSLDALTAEYHYPMSKVASAWGHSSIARNDDGTVTLTRLATDTNKNGAMYLSAPDGTLDASKYSKLVIKAKDVTGISSIHAYFSTSASIAAFNNAEFAEGASKNMTLSTVTNGDYKYFVLDLEGHTYWSGTIKRFMLSANSNGSFTICDVYLTNSLDNLTVVDNSNVVEKLAFYASADSITTDNGTVTLTPYVRYADGHESTEAGFITDSVNAQLTYNDDGTLTLTGKINGSVTVTALINGVDETPTKTITISGQNERMAVNNYKLLVYGNSIARHGVATNIGWSYNWGMAASAEDKDYAHRLQYYMNSKFGTNSTSLTVGTSIASFEWAIPADDATKNYSETLAAYMSEIELVQPDIISLQMGENVSTNPNVATYKNAVKQFIDGAREKCPNVVIVLCTPFWGGAYKITAMTELSEEYGAGLANLHKLNSREYMAWDNQALADAIDGVKNHPGDKGMDTIAKYIFDQANLTLSANDRTVYTTVPKSISINGSDSITTPDGTATLTASILPSDAPQDVTWSVDNKNFASITQNGVLTARNNGTVTVTATSRYNDELTATYTVTISGQTEPYTITYNANTTDTVTELPAPNAYAKGNYTFDDGYPVRETYKFLGWALTPDGEVVKSVLVDKDITVYAKWELATSWSFDTDGYKENFTVENGFNQYVLDGRFMSIATDTNVDTGEVLKVVSPKLNVASSDYYALVVTMQNTEIKSDTVLHMVIHTTDGDFTFDRQVVTREYTTYSFLMSDITGTVTGFEFTPTNVDCTINLDEIAFMKKPLLGYSANTTDTVSNMPVGEFYGKVGDSFKLSALVPVRTGYTFLGWSYAPTSKLLIDDEDVIVTSEGMFLYAVWDKNDHWEFDDKSLYNVSNVDSTKTTFVDGILHYETTTSNDPIVGQKKKLGYTAESTSGKIKVKMKWTSNATMCTQIFFQTSVGPALSETHSAKTWLTEKSVDDWKYITVDLTGATDWSGTINSLRFDLTSAKEGTADVDYMRFTDSEANIVTANGSTRKVTSDDATYIVRKGGTLAPQGVAVLKNLHLSGDIDMTNGVIRVTDTVEIADTAPYTVFTLDMATAGVTNADYMYIAGYDSPIAVANGKYIVKLDNDGVGFVYFGNSSDVTKKVLYKVTESGATSMEKTFTTMDSAVSVRTGTLCGVRFRAMAALSMINATVADNGFAVTEYGFLVSTEKKLSDVNALNMAAYNDGKAAKGIAHNATTDVIYAIDDENVIYTAVLIGLPDTAAAYQTKLFIRPYTVLSNGSVIYGNPISDTMYAIAKRIAEASTGDEEHMDFIQNIIDTVEA